MSDILYSLWHRTLGYSYFAMDVDYVEIRNNMPVAVIETSLCTSSYRNCDGEAGVFNRFLRETGGFQFEVTYWVDKWLKVPAYVICFDPQADNPFNKIHMLNLQNGESLEITNQEYHDFMSRLPNHKEWFPDIVLDLPSLLEKLHGRYPGIDVYPYFQNKQKWLGDYQRRQQEITNRIERVRPSNIPKPKRYPVKGETTGDRPKYYDILRNKLNFPFVNINWVEWRKDSPDQRIGRPAAIIKTENLANSSEFEARAKEMYTAFIASQESRWWSTIAEKMVLNWYYVVYVTNSHKMGDKFHVWRSDGASRIMNQASYVEFLMRI